MPSEVKEMEMEEIMELSAKRLKTLEVVNVNSTDSTSLYFAVPNASDKDSNLFFAAQPAYKPSFTYPFFGQEELFKGVAKASLKICFDPRSFYAFISFTVDEDGQSLKDELLQKLTDFMPEDGWTMDWNEFVEQCSNYQEALNEFGEIRTTIDVNDSTFSVVKCSFDNEKFRKLHERVQTLLLFFIEASSYIDDEDTKWHCYMMFRKAASNQHELVGYSTLYPFLYYPDKIRMRLSQFLILPQFHRLGLGSKLYRHVYQDILDNPDIMELHIEDPSEEFSAFRLANDYAIYTNQLDKVKTMDRSKLKFSEGEFELVEQLHQFIQIGHDEDDKAFRLSVKKALWRRNQEIMPDDNKNDLKTVLKELYEDRIELFKTVLKL